MRTRSRLVCGVAMALFAFAATAAAQTQASSAQPTTQAVAQAPVPSGVNWEGVFSVGAIGTSTDGYQGRIAEYKVTDEDALAAIRFMTWGDRNGLRYDISLANGGDSRNQDYAAYLDFNRYVQAHVKYRTLPHRLDHDPLTYVDGGIATFIVRNTDNDPTAAYSLRTGDFDAKVNVNLANVNFFVGHERSSRSGYHQALTTNHCANCHVESFSRRMSELTTDVTAGMQLKFDSFSANYTFLNREFEDSGTALFYTYDKAQQPQTLADVFLGRVQYEQRSGALPFATEPSTRKYAHTVRARLDVGDGALTGNFTHSNTKNEAQDLSFDYTGGFARLYMPFGNRVALRADFRRYSVDNDSVFVDVIELVTPAGPEAGKTYAQSYPAMAPLDYVRESSLSRTPTEFGVELIARPAKRTSLRVGYNWEEIKRDFYEVEKTTTNTFYVAGRSQLGKMAHARFRFEYDDIRDPFAYKHAAIPAVLQPFPTPGGQPFGGLQYFEMYAARQADLTSYPSGSALFDGAFTWTPDARVAVTGHYRWRDSQNDDLNFSEWSRTMHTPGVNLWVAADDRWAMTAGYVYQRERLDTLFTTLAFAG